MKEDKPKGKSQSNQSEQDQSEQEMSDSQSSTPRKDEEDVDFEILDALEQIEQAGKDAGETELEEDSDLDLNLDEDLAFQEDLVGDTERFHIDEDETTEAGEEGDDSLAGLVDEFRFDTTPGDDIGEDVHAVEDEDEHDLDLSFDDDIDLDLDENSEDSSLDIEASEEMQYEIDSELEEPSDETSFDMTMDSFEEESFDFGEEDVDKESEEDDFPTLEELAKQAEVEAAQAQDDETFGEVDFEELPDMEESFDLDVDIEDEDTSATELSDMNSEQDSKDFSGKSVISVDGDEVIDLGDESELENLAEGEMPSSLGKEEAEAEDFLTEESEDFDLEELEKNAQQIISEADAELSDEDEEAEDFMASLDDIEIDLQEEAPDLPEAFDTGEEEEEPDVGEDFDDSMLNQIIEEAQTAEEREAGLDSSELISDELTEEEEIVGELEPEVDERIELGLTPRLTDAEIEKFEEMVTEAKTLQEYIEELEEHKTEIKERIYAKLSQEYTARKTEIFREPEFISVRIDVEQDLQDMLDKRDDFTATIARLNEELDEVNVRHLVGEYTDDMLAGKEETQTAEIEQWQEKSGRLESFIIRYQDLLNTERALNPIEEEEESAEETAIEEPELETSTLLSDEEFTQEGGVEELSDLEEPEALTEVETSFEEEVPADDLSEEMAEIESLTNIFDEDTEDWESDEDEEFEITAEGLSDEDFSADTDLGEEEDFDLDSFVDTEDIGETSADFEEEESEQEEMVNCKKCGKSTPASEKFCVNCGAKAQ